MDANSGVERARPFRLPVVSPETCGLGTPNQHCCLTGRTRCDDATPRKGREAQRPPAEHQLTPSSAAQRLPPSSKTHYEPRAARTGQAKRSPHRLQGSVTSPQSPGPLLGPGGACTQAEHDSCKSDSRLHGVHAHAKWRGEFPFRLVVADTVSVASPPVL